MNVFELFGTIAIDHSEAERGLDKTVRHAKDAENALEKTFKRIGKYVATAFSVSAIVNFGKTCTQVYADVAAEEAAFAQIMGDYADTAQDKLDAVADKTGITSTRMTSAFNSLTAKFKGLGYSTEDATTLAADGLMIAADASAFWNMSLDEAMAHLNSFINGSYEGGEAIGLFANDTQMAAYAIEKGIVADAAAWSKLDEATKQALRLDFARTMQANSGVTGQAAEEADAFANVLGNLQEAWRQLQAVIGKPILEKFVLPAMQKLNEFLPVLTENVQKGIDWLTEGFDKIAEYFSEVFTEDGLDMKALPNALRDMFRDVSRAIPALLSSVGRSIRNAWVNTVWPAVQGAFKMAFGVELPKWSDIESAVVAWWDGGNGIAAEIAKVCNWTLNMFGVPATVTEEDVNTILSSWWEGAKGLVSSFCDWTLKLFSNPVEAASDVEETVKKWWIGVKSGAENALVWTLKLFGVPEAKADAVKNLVSGWWQGVKQKAQDALVWTLKLFENPKETAGQIATNISTWWAGVVASAQSALEWWLQLFENPKETAEKVGEVVGEWWKGVKADAEAALVWALQLFDLPEADGEDGVVNTITQWWNGISSQLASVLGIDLSSIDIAGIFTAASTAIDNVIEDAKTFVSDVSKAIAWDMSGRLNLSITLSNLFNAGVTAIGNLLGSASTLVGDIVAAVTGDKEAGQKIGGVFSDLFGWAAEIIVGVKDGAIGAFQWLLDHKELVIGALSAIATEMVVLAAANPATALIASLTALIGIMSTDWDEFETKYPHLVQMFKDLTGLDFSTVADSLGAFKSGLQEIIDWFTANEATLDMMCMVLGGIIFTAHPVAGAALIAYGAGDLWTAEGVQKEYARDLEETGVPPVIQDPFVNNSDSFVDWASIFRWLSNSPGGSDDKEETETPAFVGPPTRPENYDPAGTSGMSLFTMMQAMTAQIKDDVMAGAQEGVAAGLSGVTITANVSTGDVKLQDGAVVGSLAPKLNMVLGMMNARSGRG